MNLVKLSLKMAQYKADTLYYKDTFNARKIRRLPVVSSGIFNVSISLVCFERPAFLTITTNRYQ